MRKVLASAVILSTSLATSAALADSPVGGGSGETAGAPTPSVTAAAESVSDVTEREHKTYYFVGLRYRGNVIPKFMVNLFVNEGATFFSNSVGLEFDVRKDHFSVIPALSYTEYGFGNTLFLEKNKDVNNPANYSMVSGSLKSMFATLDMLWSTPIHKNIDFEYGLGVGVGVLFGDIANNWVTTTPQTGAPSVAGSNGTLYYQCQTEGVAPSCNRGAHSGATVAKVGGYTEPKWTDGGSVPNAFIHLSLPQIGLRFKPVKEMEARIGGGFSLTGFWFGLSGNYGIPSTETTRAAASR